MRKLVGFGAVAIVIVLAWGVAFLDVGTRDSEHPLETTEQAPAPPVPEEPIDDALDPTDAHVPDLANGQRDPEFQQHARRFATEPRDATWASEREQRLYRLLDAFGWKGIAHVHCRRTVCRIALPGASPADLSALLALPDVKALDLDPIHAYEIDNGAIQTYASRSKPIEDGAVP